MTGLPTLKAAHQTADDRTLFDVPIVGGGQAGLATEAALKQGKLTRLLLEELGA